MWRGVLLDVGGVLLVGDRAAPGAADTLRALRRRGIPLRLLSNTSSCSRATLADRLRRAGLEVETPEVLTATTATADHLRGAGGTSLFFVAPDARADLAGLAPSDDHPDHVVVGDTDAIFARAAMDRAVRALRHGADLVAMARNRWYQTAAGPAVDVGAAVAALEYAAEVEALVVGKPSPGFFRQGVRSMGLPSGAVVMVGDDPEADVLGAQRAGLDAVYVGPRRDWAAVASVPATIPSIGHLLELFPQT